MLAVREARTLGTVRVPLAHLLSRGLFELVAKELYIPPEPLPHNLPRLRCVHLGVVAVCAPVLVRYL